MAKKTLTFEASMERLEEIMHTLEGGKESLDDSLKLYEEGIGLIRACTARLEAAEQKVKILQMNESGNAELIDLSLEEEK